MRNGFAKNLKDLRKLCALSQAQLAERLSVTVKTLSHWETAYSEPSIQQILAIAEYFGITVDELLKG